MKPPEDDPKPAAAPKPELTPEVKAPPVQTPEAKADPVAEQLAAITAERDVLKTQNAEQASLIAAFQQKEKSAATEAALSQFGELATPEMRSYYESNPTGALAILNTLQASSTAAAATPAAPAKDLPEVVHDPAKLNGDTKTAESKQAEGEALIKKLRSEGKFSSYDAALNEARRRSPELFA